MPEPWGVLPKTLKVHVQSQCESPKEIESYPSRLLIHLHPAEGDLWQPLRDVVARLLHQKWVTVSVEGVVLLQDVRLLFLKNVTLERT